MEVRAIAWPVEDTSTTSEFAEPSVAARVETRIEVGGIEVQWNAIEDGKHELRVGGVMDGRAGFDNLAQSLDGDVEIDVGSLRFGDVDGIREWSRFLRDLEQRRARVSFHHCTDDLIDSVRAIVERETGAGLASFISLYECSGCGYVVSGCLGPPNPQPLPCDDGLACGRCGALLLRRGFAMFWAFIMSARIAEQAVVP